MARTTRDKVKVLLEDGLRPAEVARVLGITPATVSYHKRKLGFAMNYECVRRHDWTEIQRYYDLGHSVRACMDRFGFSTWAWTFAVRRGAVKPRPRAMPIDQLVGRVKRSRTHLKRRLINAGLLEPRCEECGIDEWRDRPLALELHHRNGDGQDNRLENLALLCPNCHSQTATWGGRNRTMRQMPPAA